MKLKKIDELLSQRLSQLQKIEPSEILAECFSTVKSGNDVVIIHPEQTTREDVIAITTIQRLQKPFMLSPRALIVAKDKESVLRLHHKIEEYSKLNKLRIFSTHEKTDIDEDKNIISVGVDVLIGTPERLNTMFSTAGFDVNQLLMYIIEPTDELLRKRFDTILSRLSESIGKTQRMYLATEETEKLYNFVDKTMLDSYWF